MAKIEEADPRWIVQERSDGTNVNQWHWQERDLSSEVHEELKAALVGAVLVNDETLNVKVSEVTDIQGDVTVAQRKGKIMCYFELKLECKYSGNQVGEQEKFEGKIKVSEIDHDTFMDEYEISVNAMQSGSMHAKIEDKVRQKGRCAFRQVIQRYVDELFSRHNVGKNVQGTPTLKSPAATSSPLTSKPKPQVEPKPSNSTLTFKILWRAPREEIWSALTDQQRVSVYTRAPAKIDPRASGVFEFFGGAMSGYFVDVAHPEKMTLQWRLGSWKSGFFSTVVITLLVDSPSSTKMEFAQAGIPSDDFERVEQGWKVNFWEPIRTLFGYGMEYL